MSELNFCANTRTAKMCAEVWCSVSPSFFHSIVSLKDKHRKSLVVKSSHHVHFNYSNVNIAAKQKQSKPLLLLTKFRGYFSAVLQDVSLKLLDNSVEVAVLDAAGKTDCVLLGRFGKHTLFRKRLLCTVMFTKIIILVLVIVFQFSFVSFPVFLGASMYFNFSCFCLTKYHALL